MYLRKNCQEYRIIVALKSREKWTLAKLAGEAKVRQEYLPTILERMKKECGKKFCDLLSEKMA